MKGLCVRRPRVKAGCSPASGLRALEAEHRVRAVEDGASRKEVLGGALLCLGLLSTPPPRVKGHTAGLHGHSVLGFVTLPTRSLSKPGGPWRAGGFNTSAKFRPKEMLSVCSDCCFP